MAIAAAIGLNGLTALRPHQTHSSYTRRVRLATRAVIWKALFAWSSRRRRMRLCRRSMEWFAENGRRGSCNGFASHLNHSKSGPTERAKTELASSNEASSRGLSEAPMKATTADPNGSLTAAAA